MSTRFWHPAVLAMTERRPRQAKDASQAHLRHFPQQFSRAGISDCMLSAVGEDDLWIAFFGV